MNEVNRPTVSTHCLETEYNSTSSLAVSITQIEQEKNSNKNATMCYRSYFMIPENSDTKHTIPLFREIVRNANMYIVDRHIVWCAILPYKIVYECLIIVFCSLCSIIKNDVITNLRQEPDAVNEAKKIKLNARKSCKPNVAILCIF